MFHFEADSGTLVALASALIVTFALGWFFASTRYRGEIKGLRDALDSSRRDVLEQLPQSVAASLNSITASALAQNNENFLELATERMHRQQVNSEASLAVRERAFDSMLDPIRDSLEATQRELHRLQQDRISSRSALSQHLTDLIDSQRTLQAETQGLAQALRRPEIRGRWGELTLRRLVELSGMSQYCDFTEQVSVSGDGGPSGGSQGGVLRPDMLVHLPGDRIVVVDAKTPLDAFLSATSASTEAERSAAMNRHAGLLKSRIRELAGKKYWDSFDQSLDFVVLFLPGDQFLSSALELDAELLDHALANKVIPATPTSLIAVLRALAASWRQQKLSQNAAELARCGDDLLEKLSGINKVIAQLGRGLDNCRRDYNRLTSSYQQDVYPALTRMQELGLRSSQGEFAAQADRSGQTQTRSQPQTQNKSRLQEPPGDGVEQRG